jgi:UDP-2,3-diacylglucosamine pyrophosphatase LpxH
LLRGSFAPASRCVPYGSARIDPRRPPRPFVTSNEEDRMTNIGGRWGAARVRRGRERLLVVLSDIEMGAGGPYDDFPHTEHLADLILSYTGPEHADRAVDLVFNGDTFDLLKTSVDGAYPHHVTPGVALAKLARVARAHRPFFAALAEFSARMGERGGVHFVVGNHDAELLFPEVQERVHRLAGGGRVFFPGFALDVGRVHIEHGSQLDPLFVMDETEPFLWHGSERLLNIPWASVALLDVAIPLQPLLYHHDRLKPKQRVLELIPEIKELLTGAFWTYWTRDYWKDFWDGGNPVKTVSWAMLKELVRRLVTRDPDVWMADDLQRRAVESDRYDLYLVGHQHEPSWWSHGRRKVLRTGAMRDEFMLDASGATQTAINKTYAEVLLEDGEVVRSHLVELDPPPRPEGSMPASIFAIVPRLREMLASSETRARPWLTWDARWGRDRTPSPS